MFIETITQAREEWQTLVKLRFLMTTHRRRWSRSITWDAGDGNVTQLNAWTTPRQLVTSTSSGSPPSSRSWGSRPANLDVTVSLWPSTSEASRDFGYTRPICCPSVRGWRSRRLRRGRTCNESEIESLTVGQSIDHQFDTRCRVSHSSSSSRPSPGPSPVVIHPVTGSTWFSTSNWCVGGQPMFVVVAVGDREHHMQVCRVHAGVAAQTDFAVASIRLRRSGMPPAGR